MDKNKSGESSSSTPSRMPNGHFKKQMFSFGLCFSWLITIFCLLFGDEHNEIHSQLSMYSFLTGVAFIFALVFKGKINTKFFGMNYDDEYTEKNKRIESD